MCTSWFTPPWKNWGVKWWKHFWSPALWRGPPLICVMKIPPSISVKNPLFPVRTGHKKGFHLLSPEKFPLNIPQGFPAKIQEKFTDELLQARREEKSLASLCIVWRWAWVASHPFRISTNCVDLPVTFWNTKMAGAPLHYSDAEFCRHQARCPRSGDCPDCFARGLPFFASDLCACKPATGPCKGP